MTDSTIMTVLKQISGCIARQFGSNCEIIIHELLPESQSSRIVHTENGHVSQHLQQDRQCPAVLDALKENPSRIEDRVACLTRTQDGRSLKSSTLYIRNGQGDITAVFSLNFDITGLLAVEGVMDSLIETGQEASAAPAKKMQNVNELLEDLIRQSIRRIGKPVGIMSKEEKKQAIKFLDEAGAFLVTRSGDKISREFGISKYTMYSYIEANRERCL